VGPYEILAPIGAGGMGEVYRALDTRLGREVAVKVVHPRLAADPERLSRFEKEARAAAQVDHPNILVVHDIGSHEGSPFIVSELLQGESLREKLGAPLPPKKAVDYAIQIAVGLAAAHEKGIVHRDIKPENVFVTKDGHVKILDFGVAKLLATLDASGVDTRTPTEIATQPGTALGTVSYMSPEQIRGQPVDARSDLFSLGAVLYEMLSGERPFQRATVADTMSAILHEDPPSLAGSKAGIPPALERIVTQCLEKQLADRLSSAHDLALALRSISTDQQLAVSSVENRRPARGRRILAPASFAAAAVLIVLSALAIFLKWPRTSAKSASGQGNWGAPRQITSAPGWEAEPAFSPDGTLVAYSSNASGNADIWVVDPDGGEPLRLTDGPAENRKPAWFPDGRSLAFVSTRSGTTSVWKVSRLGGSANLLLENGDMPAISPDGTRIALSRAGPSGKLRIWVAPLADPSRAERLTGDDEGHGDHVDPAWSPDGTHLCYSDQHDLWLASAGAGRARRLTRDGVGNWEPVFSHDGLSVYFSSFRAEPQSIWRASLDGGEPERITPGTGTTNHPSLSRDGRRLVFSTLFIDFDVVVADRKTGTVCRIASSRDDFTPAIVPDGSAVIYVSNRLGKHDLWVEALESGCPGTKPPRRLTNLEIVATPVVSPDGRWVAFFRVLQGGKRRDIWAVPLSGGTPVALVTGSAQNIHPAYSPDGKRLAFISDRSGLEHVWIVSLLEGLPSGEPWRLTDGAMADLFPAWSPEGGRIAFIRGSEAWVTDARPGAAPRRITTGADPRHVAWEPDGTALLVSGLFGTTALHLLRVEIASGVMERLKPHLVLGDRNASGHLSLSRDGRFLATDITEPKGNLWMTVASRDGR
jgi:Tol biopolymer transport system component